MQVVMMKMQMEHCATQQMQGGCGACTSVADRVADSRKCGRQSCAQQQLRQTKLPTAASVAGQAWAVYLGSYFECTHAADKNIHISPVCMLMWACITCWIELLNSPAKTSVNRLSAYQLWRWHPASDIEHAASCRLYAAAHQRSPPP